MLVRSDNLARPGHQVLGFATLSRHWSARQTFWSTLRPADSGTEMQILHQSQCFSDISSARACSPYRLTKLQTACACMHVDADLGSKLSKLSYNGKSYPFCTASHQTTLVLQRKAFHRNGADRVVGFLHEAHTGKLRHSREANFRQFHRFVLLHLITIVVRLCDFCLHGSSRVEAQRDILNMYRRLCLQVSLKITSEAHRRRSLRFGGGWVL